jgi:hypothetical protein
MSGSGNVKMSGFGQQGMALFRDKTLKGAKNEKGHYRDEQKGTEAAAGHP